MADAISPSLTTLFAELLQQVETAPEAGSVYRRISDSGEYLYAKVKVGSGRIDRFVGKAGDPAAELQANALTAGAQLAKERRKLVGMLKGQGRLAAPDRTMGLILDVLAQAGLFKSGAVLVGTAAYLVSEPLVGHRLPSPTLMTGDLDLATATVAICSTPPERLEDILRRADDTFEGIPQVDPKAPPSRYRNSAGYLVDLLTPTRTRDDTNPVRLRGLDAGAAPLQYLAWLIADAVPAVALSGPGILVQVPQPARFAVHKLILAQRRDAANRIKRTKDLQQAKAIIQALRAQDPYGLEDALADAFAQGETGWAQPIKRSLQELGL
ncbi:GSU2403 family nucleotidyltransferase fold protein [Caulobacter sp. 73W]|uniref:GSU2403 family nucleotidyltransferase fold protein n=1 Tax=Caulobacter sp. 73W TaxID=3161137 RepID=A0AB39KWY8_9CAUL